jgi:ABC-type hemin transport system substrate-binding protein
VLAFDGLFLLGFGPRLPQAVAQLAQRTRSGA